MNAPASATPVAPFFALKRLSDGLRQLVVVPSPGGGATLYLGDRGAREYAEGWEFASVLRAVDECWAWDPRDDPAPSGWVRRLNAA